MKILKVKARNFGPYGKEWIEFEFSTSESSFSLLSGLNGSGKSTCMDIIQFGLFGKVANKKQKTLPNRFNQNLEVYIELIASQKFIIIERGLEPNYFKVSVDGDEKFGDKAGKLDVQDILENELFGIPYHIFNNIISLSVNDFKSFIKMAPRDKRIIIDKIFGLSVINDMYEELKTDIKFIKETNSELTNKTYTLTNQIDRTTEELEKLNQKIMEKSSNRKEEIHNYIEKLKVLKDSISLDFNNLNVLNKERNDNIRKVEEQITHNKATFNKINEKLQLFKLEKCPTCESDLQTEYYKDLEKTFNKDKNKLSKNLDELKIELSTLENERAEIISKQSELKTKAQKIDMNNTILLKELKELENVDKIDEQTFSMKKLIKEVQEELDSVQVNKKKTESKKKFYEIIEDILGDNGVKQMALRTILPTINVQINQFIKELGLEFNLEFDEKFNAKLSQFGEEIDPVTLSTGENKKLDFAVIISIIKLMKIKFPGLNLLFLDEILSSLDSNSTHHVLYILSKLSRELNLHIMVVNHAPIDNNIFDYLYRVEKINQYSTIIKEKML